MALHSLLQSINLLLDSQQGTKIPIHSRSTPQKRYIAEFEAAYKSDEVSEYDWNQYLSLREKLEAIH